MAATDESNLRKDKLFLYYTQFGKCMYSGEPIDLEAALRNDETYDIDHIFPRSRIKDDSIDNRVLVKRVLNREKTNTYPISQDIRSRMLPFWSMLHDKKMIGDKKYDRLKRNTELTEDELASFVQRQLTETQQSTKALAQLLKERYPESEIVYSKAGNISEFRQKFEMLKCREVNDLHHAKDAYLNIVVGNVYKTKFTDRFFLNIRKENYSLKEVFDWDTPGAWKADGTSIATVKKYMAKNNPIITRMPRETKGALFGLMPVSRENAKIPLKANKPAEKYGGYTGRVAAYFIVVEHAKGKKRIRTIEPVYIYAKEYFEKNPEEYCTGFLKLIAPKVICYKIYAGSIIEINGCRLELTGGSESTGDGRDIYNHTYQLVISGKESDYVKQVLKYLKRCQERRTEIPITPYDGVNREENIDLYKCFCNKLATSSYGQLFSDERKVLENNAEGFALLSVPAQCRVLSEILKIFICDAQKADLKELCGKAVGKRVRRSANISSCNSVFLIHQSPTGLYEYRTDLLH